ncbi:hypothetical protein ACET3X_005356 [Alternaria dauci]|uniref:Mid2 domain-containing protein n=1 Tax=Alternaria dauci TaxID=48095 RepID=A0ABR3UK19_9PLEO
MRVATSIAVFLSVSPTVLATCYFPNGNVVDSDTACNPNAIVSSCCYDNQACLSNGLCVSDPHDPVKARYHRGTCTDQAWKSGNCVRQCLDIEDNGAPVYSCNATDTDSYCCGDDCECENPFEVFSFNQSPADVYTMTIILESFTQTHTSTPSATSSAPSSSTSPTSVLVTSTTLASATTRPESQGGSINYVALGVGLGVGLGIGIPAALIAAFFFWRRKKGYKPANDGTESPMELNNELNNEDLSPPQEKYAYDRQTEVPGDIPAAELPATPHEPIELASPTNPTPNTGTATKYH